MIFLSDFDLLEIVTFINYLVNSEIPQFFEEKVPLSKLTKIGKR